MQSNLITQLNDLLVASQELMQLLREEAGAVAAGDIDSLSKVGLAKQDQLQRVEHLEQNPVVRAFGAENSGVHAKGHTPVSGDGQAQVYWQQIVELAGQCQRQNLINGRMLRLRTELTQTTLNIISGRRESPLYGASGTLET